MNCKTKIAGEFEGCHVLQREVKYFYYLEHKFVCKFTNTSCGIRSILSQIFLCHVEIIILRLPYFVVRTCNVAKI